MGMQMNRRRLLQQTGLAAAGVALSPFLQQIARAEDAASGPPKKVLFFTKSQTFQHSVIARPKDDPTQLAFAEKLLTDWGKEAGFEVTCTKDGREFTPEKIKDIDVFAFCTTGDLTKPSPGGRDEPPMTDEGLKAFLDAIADGKGYVGFHCASDTLHSAAHIRGKTDLLRDVDENGKDEFSPYIQMIGGEFIVHGAQQDALLKCIDPKFPGAKAYSDTKFTEEWYSLKNFANDLHVILAQDCTGMKGPMYARGTYPETWIRMHHKGRVFYTSMGHREDVWQRPDFKPLVLGAMNWASGRIDVDTTPNISTATPDANVKAS